MKNTSTDSAAIAIDPLNGNTASAYFLYRGLATYPRDVATAAANARPDPKVAGA